MEIIFALFHAIVIVVLFAAAMIKITVFAFDKAYEYSEHGHDDMATIILLVGILSVCAVGFLGSYLTSLLTP